MKQHHRAGVFDSAVAVAVAYVAEGVVGIVGLVVMMVVVELTEAMDDAQTQELSRRANDEIVCFVGNLNNP